ncbi:MAG: metallophosphoesterase [Rhodospirillaceae bacterium]|nr:metallophosphoesterase [Rhodospirillaceae bacterium]
MARQVSIIVGILALLNAFGAWRVMARIPWAGDHPALAWLTALGFFALQMAGPFGDHLWFPAMRRAGLGLIVRVVDWISHLAFGAMSLMVVFAIVLDAVTIPWRLIAPPADPLAFDRAALMTMGAAIIVTMVIGIWQARRGPVVHVTEVPLANLPPAFDGFRIAQISDLHVGPTIGRGYVRSVVDMVNGTTPDMIALTGDFADSNPDDVEQEIAPLAGLKATHGAYFVTGNHEYFWDAAAWMAAFRRMGAKVLTNEHIILRRGTDAMVVAGVTDYSTRRMGPPHGSNPAGALAGAPDTMKILLAHQPASHVAAEKAGADLQLSGHTHSGQYFPFNLMIGWFQRYYKGLNRHGALWIYVNQGTGYWGPPLRTGVPAEVTLLILRRTPS